ncbi:MAG: hypothetical protein LBT06_10875 [Hungatella sp.]|jgi:ribosomal protein L37AE/L43A|nr:hypothetical protein [Hungatella sp.]
MNKKGTKETITYNGIGEEIHVFDGQNGREAIKKLHAKLPTGKEYCPDCHKPIIHKAGYWECQICKYSITDEESEYGDGYPTLESTYEEDYGNAFDNHDFDDEA